MQPRGSCVCCQREWERYHTHTHCSQYVSGEITPFTDTWSSRHHILVVTQHTLVHFFLPVSPSSQRGVSMSKLVVCYAGDF